MKKTIDRIDVINELINNHIYDGEKLISNVKNKRDRMIYENNKLLNMIINTTNYLNDNVSLTERLCHIIRNYYDVPLCKNCGKQLFFDSKRIHKGKPYLTYCSVNCKTEFELKNDIFKMRAQKMKITRSKIDQDGNSSYKIGGQKMKQTKLNDIDENGLNNYQRSSRKAMETMRNTIDINTGLSISKLIGQKTFIKRSKINEFGINDYQLKSRQNSTQLKRRKTNEINNKWIPIDQLSDFKKYKYEVLKVTNNQPIHTLDNFNLRGRHKYHLDHIVSIYDGFQNNISPLIIGNINNLRFILESENCSKNKKSDMTIDELIKKITL